MFQTYDSIADHILTLPAVLDITKQKKRYAGQPDMAVLKGQQIPAVQLMQRYLGEGLDDFEQLLIRGYAGTGKTFSIGKAIEDYLFNNRTHKIAMTAPTNKAVNQLYKAADFVHTNLTYKTIHSLLGLIEKIDNYGKQIFIQDKRRPPSIEEYQVLVIDEISMLNDELYEGSVLMNGITYYVEHFGLKVIMMGDPAQIPPVNKNDCIPLQEAGQIKHKIKVVDLTEPQRQSLDSPIFMAGMKIRNAINRPVTWPAPESAINQEGKGVVFFRGGEYRDEELLEKMLETYYPSANFAQDADFMKTIAWRNKTVNYMNDVIREMIYGKQQAKSRIVIGEKLVCNKPVFEGAYIIFNTNDELSVKSFDIQVESINNGQFQINYYSTLVSYETPDGRIEEAYIKLVHESSMPTYTMLLEKLISVAMSCRQGTWEAGKAWTDKFTFEQNFADVSYNYSITGHKAQGSTYSRTLVLAKDMDKNTKVTERNRIKYTACTRPKDLLFIVT